MCNRVSIDDIDTCVGRIGPLVEVPVLLTLSYLALFLRGQLDWESERTISLA